jgi:hypothetical protein
VVDQESGREIEPEGAPPANFVVNTDCPTLEEKRLSFSTGISSESET